MKNQKLGIILISISLLQLSACSSLCGKQDPQPTKTEVYTALPPASLIVQTEKPVIQCPTNECGDQLTIDYNTQLDSCNADKQSLREWRTKMKAMNK